LKGRPRTLRMGLSMESDRNPTLSFNWMQGSFVNIVGAALLLRNVLASAPVPWFGFHQLLVKLMGERCHLEGSHARGAHIATELADLL
jgi:hypothetical protein